MEAKSFNQDLFFKRVAEAYANLNKQNGNDKNLTTNQIKQVIQTISDVLAELAANGESFTIRGFLKIGAKLREAGTSINPKTGEKVETKTKMMPKISYTKGFVEKVQEIYNK